MRFTPIATVLVLLAATSFAAAAEKPDSKPGGRTEISDIPWTPAPGAPDKVIYGTDDRLDVFQETNPDRRSWAASTCGLFAASDVVEQEDGTFALRASAYRIWDLGACEGEPYADQPVAAYCTGFMVGPDLIATAGHCYSDADLASARFVFGFQMADAATPNLTFERTQVYTGVEVVTRRLEGDYDYAVIRVDRPIEAPDARVLRLRTAGNVAPGTNVGLIGHPAGLPMKIAFGENTVVRSSDKEGFLTANVDAYGGNSGSPVFNAETGLVEGILVRGAGDFVWEADCFRSDVLPDDTPAVEEISKSTTFARFVQPNRGTLTLDRVAYPCAADIAVGLYDLDLEGAESATVRLTTSGGDSETLTLAETPRLGAFRGTITLAPGEPVADDGILQAAEGDSLYAAYRDSDTGNAAPGDAVATARVDCTAPEISGVAVEFVGGNRAIVTFMTNEATTGIIAVGPECGAPAITTEGDVTNDHRISVSGLERLTPYFFTVSAMDGAGNASVSDNGGGCFTFTTIDELDFFTQGLFDGTSDLAGRSITFTPDDSASGYSACTTEVEDFPTSPFCGEPVSPGDDGFVMITLAEGRAVTLYGVEYNSFYVNGNGFLTFDQSDSNYWPDYAAHFAIPRISGFFSDLYTPAGGLVSVAELEDRVAVTYYNVLDYYGDLQSFQIEMFDDGAIRQTWMTLTYPYGIVGLSDGSGLNPDFVESDLNAYATCGESPYHPIECEVEVPNDHCADAPAALLGQRHSGVTFGALGSGDAAGCDFCHDPDVWYTFTPATTGTYSISLCGSTFDTMLELYEGNCDNLQYRTSNDDGICDYASTLAAELTGGTTYRIRISGYGGTEGNYELMITVGAKGGVGCNMDFNAPDSSGPIPQLALFTALTAILIWRARKPRRSTRG